MCRGCVPAVSVERGIVPVGTVSGRIDAAGEGATVAADGTVVSGGERGSIHKIGAAVQNAPSCNGWTFWHLERDGELVALDKLRGA